MYFTFLMKGKRKGPEFPEKIQFESGGCPVLYVRTVDYFAVRSGDGELRPDGEVAFHLEGGEISVYRCRGTGGVAAAVSPELYPSILPVYRLGEQGPLAVATGAVFIRFAEGDAVEAHRSEIEQVDFRIDRGPAYATHAAWVRPSSGRVDEALVRLPDLLALPGVESVEPQMLLESARR